MERKKVIKINVSDKEVSKAKGDLMKKGCKVTKEQCSDGSWNLMVEYDEKDEKEVQCCKPVSTEPWW